LQQCLLEVLVVAVFLLPALKPIQRLVHIRLPFPVVWTQYRYWLLVAGAVLIVMRLALQVELPHLTEAHCKLLAGQAAIVLELLLVELEPPFQETLAAAMAAMAV
jgi:hypothetical protein